MLFINSNDMTFKMLVENVIQKHKPLKLKIMTDQEKYFALIEYIQILKKSVDGFVTAIGKPLIIAEPGKERLRYAKPNSLMFQVLKAVRVVSGLHACMALLQFGFTQEIGVLLRTIHDFLNDILYIQEAHVNGAPTRGQQDMIAHFFESDLKTTEEMTADQKKIHRPTRNEVTASHTRLAKPFENPEIVRRGLNAIEDVFSGYVHGDYPQIMEMYLASLSSGPEQFCMQGMPDSPRIMAFRWHIASHVHRSLNMFQAIARNLKLDSLADQLLEKRKAFEVSELYAAEKMLGAV